MVPRPPSTTSSPGPRPSPSYRATSSAVAKALRDFAKGNPNLVVKGGMVGTGVLSPSDIEVLADLPSKDTLLAQFAGALSAPMQQLAGLIQALPRNLAFGLSALVEQRRASGEGVEAEPAVAEEAPAAESDETAAPRLPHLRPPAEAARRPSPQPRPQPEAPAAAEAEPGRVRRQSDADSIPDTSPRTAEPTRSNEEQRNQGARRWQTP